MQDDKTGKQDRGVSRRDFIKASAAVSLAAMVPGAAARAFAQAPERVRIGLIGGGGRGSSITTQCLGGVPGTQLVAIGDIFEDHLDRSLKRITERAPKGSVNVGRRARYTGFDAFKGVIGRKDVDMVILTTPPGFRPEHYEACIKAGKHVFMEKPAAVDPVGVRSIIATSELADKKSLTVGTGTQRRHQPNYMETIKRIHDGAIGEIVGAQCYWNTQGMMDFRNVGDGQPKWSEMERQIRSWYYYTWLCGDHIVEQHVHQLDVMYWVIGELPVKATAMGGAAARKGPRYGNIFDHFAAEFEYANGMRILSMCRQSDGASSRVSERVVGTKGASDCAGTITGENPFTYEGEDARSAVVNEFTDTIASIRGDSSRMNYGKRIAESTMMAILGRESAYTGRDISWAWMMNKSTLDLRPPKYAWGPNPIPKRAVPGQTKLAGPEPPPKEER